MSLSGDLLNTTSYGNSLSVFEVRFTLNAAALIVYSQKLFGSPHCTSNVHIFLLKLLFICSTLPFCLLLYPMVVCVRGLAPKTQVDLSGYSVTIELCDSYCLGIGDYRVVQWRSLYMGFG